MFKKVLVSNRGEIAVRIITALREMGIRSVAIFSEPDKHSRHVKIADECWQLEGQPAQVYLDYKQIIELAKRSGSQAIHPGYGFLAENADFAEACTEAGITFIGPSADVIRKMGSKIEARKSLEAAGVPVVPGTTDPVTEVDAVKQLGTRFGYPIAIKASSGGGGRGLKVVHSDKEVEQALTGAAREGASYFGDSKVYVEKYLDNPRHIEVQVLADSHGNTVHLRERDCSSQRRHQKVLEEAPAFNLNDQVVEGLLAAAVKGASSLGYTSAGTMEFLVAGDEFYFLEMNTRVQVEHPITEAITGIDIVKEQIRIAFGQPLSFSQADVSVRGHAIECRINAEDPFKNFMPNPGTITTYSEPSMPWVRVDSALYEGYQVLPFYDSLLAKLVVWGRDRQEAIARTRLALAEFKIEGVKTTIPFHQILLEDPCFLKGKVYTTYVEKEMREKLKQAQASQKEPVSLGKPDPANSTDLGAVRRFEINVNQRHFQVSVAEILDSDTKGRKAEKNRARPDRHRSAAKPSAGNNNNSGEIRSSMNGMVKKILVKEGDKVEAGQKLIIFEAMKMESEIVSSKPGHVKSIKVKQGQTVDASALLLLMGD